MAWGNAVLGPHVHRRGARPLVVGSYAGQWRALCRVPGPCIAFLRWCCRAGYDGPRGVDGVHQRGDARAHRQLGGGSRPQGPCAAAVTTTHKGLRGVAAASALGRAMATSRAGRSINRDNQETSRCSTELRTRSETQNRLVRHPVLRFEIRNRSTELTTRSEIRILFSPFHRFSVSGPSGGTLWKSELALTVPSAVYFPWETEP